MDGSSKYNPFGVADIERYHRGEMSAAERHALEKAALDDPFLAEALEGYSFTSTPVADVNAVREKFELKLQKRKRFFLYNKNYSWLRIAALFLVLAGSGWFLYQSGMFNKKEIAKTTSQEKAGTIANKIGADSRQSFNQKTVDSAEPSKTETSATASSHPTKKQKINKAGVQKEISHEEFNSEVAISSPENSPPTENASRDLAIKALPENNNAVLSKRAAAGNAHPGLPNKNDTFSESHDSVSNAMAIKGVQASNDTITNVNVVMQPSKEEMSEVEVVGFGAKKRAVTKPTPKFEELEPAQGWGSFNDYIASHLKEPEEVKAKTLSGDVELSFEVNQEGQPTNIKIEKSLCSTCDEEAIRLLKEGPKWKKKKDKKGKVTIHF